MEFINPSKTHQVSIQKLRGDGDDSMTSSASSKHSVCTCSCGKYHIICHNKSLQNFDFSVATHSTILTKIGLTFTVITYDVIDCCCCLAFLAATEERVVDDDDVQLLEVLLSKDALDCSVHSSKLLLSSALQ